ncbi:MAG: glycosyltransferase family 2 protein, partial [Flavobacteriaceae bacterium]|nr:glycosyltransferase family 2 protein [Flavobacteriaceae bacterium]
LKNAPKNKGLGLIFSRLCLDGIAGVKFLFEGKPLHTFAILKGHFSFYRNMSKMLKKRTTNPNKKNYFSRSSIVWDYYVKGMRQ